MPSASRADREPADTPGTGRPGLQPILCAAACVAGAAGVALGAVAAHLVAEPRLATAAFYLLVNAVAVLALGAPRRRSRLHSVAQILLLIGSVLFSGALAWASLGSFKLSPSPAPTGGVLIIVGWLVAAAGFLRTAMTKTR